MLKSTGESFFTGLKRRLGRVILLTAPYLMKLLSIVGTVAMFLVGGGIITHNIPSIHHAVESLSPASPVIPAAGNIVSSTVPALSNMDTGVLVGTCLLVRLTVVKIFYSGIKL